MTTPAMPLMPFSVPHVPKRGAYSMTIPEEFRNTNSSGEFELPAGFITMRFTWDGIEALRYLVKREQEGEWETVIPESPTPTIRKSKLIEFTLDAPARVLVQTGKPASEITVGARAVAGVMVVPLGASPF